jgi:hypothetical protein
MQTKHQERSAAAAPATAEIVLKVHAKLKSLVPSIEKLLEYVLNRTELLERDGRAVDYAAIECAYIEHLAAIERASHQCTLKAAARDAERVMIRGEEYVCVAIGNGTYRGMPGPIEIPRNLYRKVGERNGKVVDAISLRIGAVGDGWLPHAAKAMAHLHQQGHSREAEQTARQLGRLPYSRASFERVPHVVGGLWIEHHADIEDCLIQEQEIPKEAKSISVSLDRTSVPMEEALPRPPGRPRKDAPKVARNFRMAYCGTVTLHDKDGEALFTLRYGQMPNYDPQLLCNSMANDAQQLLDRRPDLRMSLLADGAADMWNLLDANFPESVFGSLHRNIDFYHVIEKLAAAAKVMRKDAGKAKALVRRWRKKLRRRKDAAQKILAQLIASGCEDVVDDAERPVHEAITYLRNHGDQMNYAGAIWKGLPIGSGNVEATCKTLIGVRMKRCGSRWKTETGNHVIQLRALALSDRWDAAMAKLLATQRTTVRRLAA